MTAQEIVDQINTLEIWSPAMLEDEIDMNGVTEVGQVERDEHRWYHLATVVFQVGSEFFGVRGPVSLKTERMGFEDVSFRCTAFLMDAVPSVTYKRRNVPEAAPEVIHVVP